MPAGGPRQDGDHWRRLLTRRVNLLDDERVGVMLITFIDGGSVVVVQAPKS